MNSLFGRKALVKVSSTPGKTQRLNYFLVNDRFHVVDLPGYGFAQAPDSVRDQWRGMMQEYLRTRRQLVGIVQLVKWLRGEELSFCLVASKIDKLSQNKRAPALRAITDALQVPGTQPLVPYSSQTGEGRVALLAWMSDTLEAASEK